MPRPALFLDRDGTLIVDVGYPRDPEQVEPLPGVLDALRALQTRYALVIISNQSGLARGTITPAESAAVHARVVAIFAAAGITFAGAYYCPHGPDDACRCRKAARDLDLDLAASIMIGDKRADVEAGEAAGCGRTIHFADANASWPAIAALL
jgi:histidinol-phosphate phosphatase family protein